MCVCVLGVDILDMMSRKGTRKSDMREVAVWISEKRVVWAEGRAVQRP